MVPMQPEQPFYEDNPNNFSETPSCNDAVRSNFGPIHQRKERSRINPMQRNVSNTKNPQKFKAAVPSNSKNQNECALPVFELSTVVTITPNANTAEESVAYEQSVNVPAFEEYSNLHQPFFNYPMSVNQQTLDIDTVIRRLTRKINHTHGNNCKTVLEEVVLLNYNNSLDEIQNPQVSYDLWSVIFKKLKQCTSSYNEELIYEILKTIDDILFPVMYHKTAYAKNSCSYFICHDEAADILISHIVPNKTFTQYVVKILNMGLSCHNWKHKIRAVPNVVNTFIEIFKTEHLILRSFVLECLQKILYNAKDFSIELIYIDSFLAMLDNVDERILFRTAQLLNRLLYENYKLDLLHYFISKNGVKICAGLLKHGSPRLQHEVVACIQYASDLPETAIAIDFKSIDNLLQPIGCSDHVLNSNLIACVANFCANNHLIKQYLVEEKNAMNLLIRTLLLTENRRFEEKANEYIYHGLMDHVLWALQLLVNVFNPPVPDCTLQACTAIANVSRWSLRFTNVIKRGRLTAINRALGILNRILQRYPEAIHDIEFTNTECTQSLAYYIFIRLIQTTELMLCPKQTVWEQSGLFQEPNFEEGLKVEENVQFIAKVFQRSCKSLSYLAGSSAIELDKIVFLFETHPTPFMWVGIFRDNKQFENLRTLLDLGIYIMKMRMDLAHSFSFNSKLCKDIHQCIQIPEIKDSANQFFHLLRCGNRMRPT